MENKEYTKLDESFFQRDALDIAPELLGKYLVRRFDSGDIHRFRITDVEVYRGEEDKACHASRGRTKRNEIMFNAGGKIYVYLIYGLHWLLNIVTGKDDEPQGIMIRGLEKIDGPGRVGKYLKLNSSFYGQSIAGDILWVEDAGDKPEYTTAPRVGIDYADEWKDMPWRFIMKQKK